MVIKKIYKPIENLTKDEILEVAKHCCGDILDVETGNEEDIENCFCESECPYLDVRENEENSTRFCRQWVMHDLIRLINKPE